MFRFLFGMLRLQMFRLLIKKVIRHPKYKKNASLLGPLLVVLEWALMRRTLKKTR